MSYLLLWSIEELKRFFIGDQKNQEKVGRQEDQPLYY